PLLLLLLLVLLLRRTVLPQPLLPPPLLLALLRAQTPHFTPPPALFNLTTQQVLIRFSNSTAKQTTSGENIRGPVKSIRDRLLVLATAQSIASTASLRYIWSTSPTVRVRVPLSGLVPLQKQVEFNNSGSFSISNLYPL